MRSGLDWERDGADWPHRGASRFVRAAGFRWHVQQLGRGPVVLLLHGTGAATHSWRGLAPRLAEHCSVVAPDLPGHGFSEGSASARSLPGMARALGELLRSLGHTPSLVVGHSAGAAIACRMSLDGEIAPGAIVSLNGALLPLRGAAGRWFPGLARLVVANPLVPAFFAWRAADPAVVRSLLRDTGSTLDDEGMRLYARLARSSGQVAAALRMMSAWDLAPIVRDLPRLAARLLLVVGGNDRFVPPTEALRIRALVPGAELLPLRSLGHLAHEERPERIAEIVLGEARRAGVLGPVANGLSAAR